VNQAREAVAALDAAPPERPQRRVRWAMYAAFAVLAALALYQGWHAQRFEQVRAADTEIIAIAGTQRTFTQQMGRLAALAGGDANIAKLHVEPLVQALDRSRADALLVEALLGEQRRLGGAGGYRVHEHAEREREACQSRS